MVWEKIGDKCIYAFIPEIEAIFAVHSLLFGERNIEFCRSVFGDQNINAWKKKYRFLFETTKAIMNLNPNGIILEEIVDEDLEHFSLELFQKKVQRTSKYEFFLRNLDFNKVGAISKKTMQKAFQTEDAFLEFYEKIEQECPNYFATAAFFKESDRYINEFFDFAKEIMNSEFDAGLAAYSKEIEVKRQSVITNLVGKSPLDYSQNLLGKTFRNQGPYERYIFISSIYMPFKCMRFFLQDDEIEKSKMKQQIMFISAWEEGNTQEKTIAALKALSDKSRYQILSILSKEGSIHGREICKKLSLSPSTVSHHMDILKECGLITEENVKTSKYYGINRLGVNQVFDQLHDDLKLSQ